MVSQPQKKDGISRIHMDDPMAVVTFSQTMTDFFLSYPKKDKPIIICIGTDRSTGDSLGPLTGWRLLSLLNGMGIEIYGTVENPVHATNLAEHLTLLEQKTATHPIIAVDACLGQTSSVGTILLEQAPLKPGAGLKKMLPGVGDFSISGVVNVGGFMEFQVLQNTRLNTVLKMAQIIANSIYLSINKRVYLQR